MLKLVLLILTLSGLQAAPLAGPRVLQRLSPTYRLPDGFRQGTEHSDVRRPIPDDFHQGTEPSRRFIVNLNTGLVQEHVDEMQRRVDFIQGNGFGEMNRRHWLSEEVPEDVPAQRSGSGWVRVEEPSALSLPDGFRQGTEPVRTIPEGFRQGTEPVRTIPEGFRQGTEPVRTIPEGFRQGTEPNKSLLEIFRNEAKPINSIPDGFRQGTEPVKSIPEGFRQGTEPLMPSNGLNREAEPVRTIQTGFRQGTEPVRTIPEGFKQGTEPSTSRLQKKTVACKGEIINGNCYEFNPKLLSFKDAQVLCRALAPNAELASVTNEDLHSRLVYLVTEGGRRSPVLTWLGGTVKNQKASWVDGSEWSYSDWMPGHPNIHTDKPVCVEMFKIDQSWWTAIDCDLARASICSYPIAA